MAAPGDATGIEERRGRIVPLDVADRLRTITLAIPDDEEGRAFIHALHRLVPTTLDRDALTFGPLTPDGALPVVRVEAAVVARPTVIFGMERPISLTVGPLRLRSTPTVADDQRSLAGRGGTESQTAATVPGVRPVPLTEMLPAVEGQIPRVDHLGVNLPASAVARHEWEALIGALAAGSTLYRYPTGEEWPFVLPSTNEEYADDIRRFPCGREPKFELCYERYFDHPLVQLDVQTRLTRDELEARFPAPSGLALPGLEDYFRSVYVAHPWVGLVIRVDMRYRDDGPTSAWDTGEWLVTAGGRIRSA